MREVVNNPKEGRGENRTAEEKDLLDSFSPNQFKSKLKLIDHIDKLNILTKNSEVVIFGSWYGSILIPAFYNEVKQIHLIDKDEKVVSRAKHELFKDTNVNFKSADIFKDFRDFYKDCDLFINTSCEHMKPMKEWGPHPAYKTPWWTRVKKNAHFAFQSNNMYGLKGHINCVKKIEDFKQQLPEQFNILVEDEVVETRGTRFTLIGNARTT